MTLSLRQRRRLQTAREIQLATLRLADARGLDEVTTEAIAERAGISTRTFFNYFPNKEAAAMGVPPGFPEDALADLAQGTGHLGADLKTFLGVHLDQLREDREILQHLTALGHSSPRLKHLLETLLLNLSEDLAATLARRMPTAPEHLSQMLAEWAMRVTGQAIRLWIEDEADSLHAGLDMAWAEQRDVARMLFG
ncbi:TetR/AcrR family transcriptional regulator [Phaeovulum vinaykumarii]|uniref:Transcriptional regulator, TetR family n=1 Tax=Phaeovulum vinaykumarii TaxID=407234 RepID=A0A1N7L9C8_9RHOB|nr:TetR family transcriptional regulator [Phaeovulum vinaykumarii]SIS70393.1 transcriptional regulator, TetR family [Phaeovulum vinaykumarii]SOB98931.1 TetR family transcriptional regulator [Phaeovulum vinaykumarii]